MADTLYKLLLHTYMYLSTYLGTYSYIGTIEVLKEKKNMGKIFTSFACAL